ncbi:Pet127p KNAG_0L00660 [Huiozyma naganishii CBS 8797]|uniref:Pet127-domain-containing protein n=1 Tax=Huiozyma naganishii (strain ATCC MYA-139 / BCRC 22969 / CBS 8797 / KCTC 17520 / NBRC 10181 / NCYC 3082 / Yp74L-3) TaxID=1071383 RepID=J7SAE7_HUIN7|nr:hypothetical protein KNAG_0L00660 [Kazachstania naganishii CBS 8797]CCK72689.1 hypothetical protein KNAG_0L00660 [Kazachstania naganishii CBS 8797]
MNTGSSLCAGKIRCCSVRYTGRRFGSAPLRSQRAERWPLTFTATAKGVSYELVDPSRFGVEHAAGNPPPLSFGLQRTLYEPVVLHPLRDTRSGVYNYDSALEVIPGEFLQHCRSPQKRPLFVTPHKDESLWRVARGLNKKYVSSTSSMTAVLSHLHYLVSNFRQLNVENSSISKNFPQKHCQFTRGAQFPASIILRRKKQGVVSIDSDKSLDREMILSVLGHSLEEFLTERPPRDTQQQPAEHYHYSQLDDFIIRSQLDAYDPQLPGSGIFDLKTRAAVSIRHDLPYVERNNNFTGYEMDSVYGEFESLEREFFEVIRSTLLKYSLQARMGCMDGIFLAYHNIKKMFGFQYLPLDEIDYIIHSTYDRSFARSLETRDAIFRQIYGQGEFIARHQRNSRQIASTLADAEFKISVQLLRQLLGNIENKLSQKSGDWRLAKVLVKTEKKKIPVSRGKSIEVPVLNVLAYPLPDDYEDTPLVPIAKTDTLEDLEQKLDDIVLSNKRLLQDKADRNEVIGFQLEVAHLQRHHRDSVAIPAYLSGKNSPLDRKQKGYVFNQLKKNYYPEGAHRDTPNFYHELDVGEWVTRGTLTPIRDKKLIVSLCQEYLNVKIDALKFQSIVRDEAEEDNSSITNRITDLLNGKFKRANEEVEGGPSQFQLLLRALSLRGELRSKRRTSMKESL